jgi:type IV secretion system protein VirB11
MKPASIVLAELRGDEAWEFIKSVNTGHPGSISTMHANGAFEAFEQLTALIKDSRTGAHLDTDYIQQRLFTTIDIVLFYHQRRLREIYYDPLTKLKYLTNAQPMMGLGSAQAAVESTVAAEEIADKKELEERYQMAAAYMRVLQSSNRLLEQHAAIAKYAALKTAFSKRDAIMARADGVSQPQVVADSADKHIVASILSGHISTLNIAEYQASEHQPVEKHHELQG